MLGKGISWATLLIAVLVAIAAIVGGAVVIWGPSGALSFQDYLNALKGFATSVGLLAIGRGVKAGLENHAALSAPIVGDDLLAPEAAAPDKTGSHV